MIKSKRKENQKKMDESCALCELADEAVKNLSSSQTLRKPKKKKLSLFGGILVLLIVMLVVAVFVIGKRSQSSSSDSGVSVDTNNIFKNPLLGSPAVDFVSTDLDGNEIRLSDFRGQKPVLLVFWATWCSFCAKELPDLKIFTDKHKEDLEVFAIASGETKDTIKEYAKEKEVNFSMLLDEKREIWNDYLIRGTPNHVLIDKDGNITTLRPGLADLENLETMLTMLP